MQTVTDTPVPRKQSRVPTPLPPDAFDQLVQLAEAESRPIANMSSALVIAALELVYERGYRLVKGKLRKVTIEDEEGGKND